MIAMDEECSSKLGLSVVGLSGRIPSARANFVAVSFQKSKMFILGGDNADKEYNDIWELDLRNKTWKKVRKELREPIVGHRSVKLRVLSKEAPIKDCGRGLLTYGGWQRNQYSDTLYLLDMYSLDLKECPRKPKSRFQEVKIPKSTIDTRKHVEKDLSIPEGRRDHAMCFQEDLNLVVLVGGWNALEWHPEQVELEIWLYTAEWRWKKVSWSSESPLPLNRRGHTIDYDPKSKSMILYGGVFGYSRFLGDCYQIFIDKESLTAKSKEIKKKIAVEYFPEGRAWHTSNRIGRNIYYIGGMKEMHLMAGEVLVLNIDTKLWHRAIIKTPSLERCGHCSVKYGESIIILGGFKESTPEYEFDGLLDQSINSSRQSSLHYSTKTTYYSLQEVVVLELLHNGLKQLDEIELQRSRSFDSKTLVRTKEFILQWNTNLFPQDQMSNQPENTFKNTKSSNVGLKEIQKKVTDHFADFDDGE